MEIVVQNHPREDIVRNCEKGLIFGNLRHYLQIGRNFSVVFREDWSSEEYEWCKDIPEKYGEMFVYGIGIEINPRETAYFVERFKNLDISLAWRMVIFEFPHF